MAIIKKNAIDGEDEEKKKILCISSENVNSGATAEIMTEFP